MPGIPYHNPYPQGIPAAKTPEEQERQKFYSSTQWKKLRARFLSLNPLCAKCQAQGRDEAAKVVHHVKERLQHPELTFRLDNLEGLCKSCHTTHHKAKGRR